jgi:hypothetical protein
MKNKRLKIILTAATILLLTPFIAMQFTEEVNWTLTDFVIGGALLFGTGLVIELVLRNSQKIKYRNTLIVAVIIIFLLIWAELAVGIFGSPFAGS